MGGKKTIYQVAQELVANVKLPGAVTTGDSKWLDYIKERSGGKVTVEVA